jgi:hypothetical protein
LIKLFLPTLSPIAIIFWSHSSLYLSLAAYQLDLFDTRSWKYDCNPKVEMGEWLDLMVQRCPYHHPPISIALQHHPRILLGLASYRLNSVDPPGVLGGAGYWHMDDWTAGGVVKGVCRLLNLVRSMGVEGFGFMEL